VKFFDGKLILGESMPIFEYVCETCGQEFEELVFGSNSANGVSCPGCSSVEVKKKISLFASRGDGNNSASFSDAAACSTGST
jgi:putative FmdB family regulatory protein